jgi:hypothetical protein
VEFSWDRKAWDDHGCKAINVENLKAKASLNLLEVNFILFSLEINLIYFFHFAYFVG